MDDACDDLKELKENIPCIEISKKIFHSKKKISTNCSNSCTQTLLISVKVTKLKESLLSIKFIENLIGIRDKGYVIHHSHIMEKIIGYAHPYCSRKVRENYCKRPVKAYNLFKFDFLFLLKGLRSGVWKT